MLAVGNFENFHLVEVRRRKLKRPSTLPFQAEQRAIVANCELLAKIPTSLSVSSSVNFRSSQLATKAFCSAWKQKDFLFLFFQFKKLLICSICFYLPYRIRFIKFGA